AGSPRSPYATLFRSALVGLRGLAARRAHGLPAGRPPAGGARRLVVALVAGGRGRQDPGPAPAPLAAGPLAGHGQPGAGHRRRRRDVAAVAHPLPAPGPGARAAGPSRTDAGGAPAALVTDAAGAVHRPQ